MVRAPKVLLGAMLHQAIVKKIKIQIFAISFVEVEKAVVFKKRQIELVNREKPFIYALA